MSNVNTSLSESPYESFKSLAKAAGYNSLTGLQKTAFSCESLCSDEWEFIIGETSSGKTLIPMLMFLRDRCILNKNTKMIFVVPYRALAAQKYIEIKGLLERLDVNLSVEQCTGEFRKYDNDILKGEVDIAVIIYEKAFLFSNLDDCFISRYQYLVLDEIGLTQGIQRGVKADYLLLKAYERKNGPRVIAMGTPFYDWSPYIESYGFNPIKWDGRPIEIKTYPVFANRSASRNEVTYHTNDTCEALSTGSLELEAEIPWQYPIVREICRYHMNQGHKILVFVNDRESVKLLSRYLAGHLDCRRWLTPDECRQTVCRYMQISDHDTDDILFNMLEDKDFYSLSRGVGFHNADLYYSLRTYIESEFLSPSGHLQIVCSTETLAYGINSSVDAVIIPEMIKNRIETGTADFLTPNEYMNYAGRAGRLSIDSGLSAEHFGYVYPIINAPFDRPNHKKMIMWNELCKTLETPQITYSRYFGLSENEKPFYILSLFPHNPNSCSDKHISKSALERSVGHLPMPADYNPEVALPVEAHIERLKTLRLVSEVSRYSECELYLDAAEDEVIYRLTDSGKRLSGYIIDVSDYEKMIELLKKTHKDDGSHYLGDVVYYLINNVKDIGLMTLNALRSCFSRTTDFSTVTKNGRKMLSYIYNIFSGGSSGLCFSEEVKHLLFLDKDEEMFICSHFSVLWKYTSDGNGEYYVRSNYERERSLRTLAALFLWLSPGFTAKALNERFKCNVQQFKRIAEGISYYLDIFALSGSMFAQGNNVIEWKRSASLTENEFSVLSKLIYYQISYRFYIEYHDKKIGLDIELLNSPAQGGAVQKLQRVYERLSRCRRAINGKKGRTKKEKKKVGNNIKICKEIIETLPGEQKSWLEKLFKDVLNSEKELI